MFFLKCTLIWLLFTFLIQISLATRTYTKNDLIKLREEVRGMFYHAYDSYLKYAYPYDELRPISCDGINTYGSYSLTLIDALDTLAIIGNYSEFARVVDILSKKTDFDSNINVSVFETNIRIIGGLLSAHLLSNKVGIKLEPGWPCNGPLLRLAEDVAKRLIVAFDTKTGMPYGTVNLRSGVPKGETTVTCTAGIGTFIVEFGTLSRLTGDPLYEEVAMNALYSLFNYRSNLGLFGNHIDIDSGRWTAQDAGIGSGVDSYFEYLVKGSILLQRPELMEMFYEARIGIDKHLKKDDWYMWVSMTKGQVTLPVFQSLEAFWPGLLSLIGETSNAMKTLLNYHQVWQQYGFTPEFYYIPQNEAGTNKESYPLRPELIESIMYLYRATGDPYLLQAGEDILRSIQHSAKTPCGYATIKDVRDHKKEDRMESFFLSETTKYLYLLFDTDNFIHNTGQYGTVIDTPNGECVIDAGGYIFNTEAHPIDPSALHCCHSISKRNIVDFKALEQNKSLFRGDSIKERQSQANVNVADNDMVSEETGPITTESSSTYIKLEDNDNISQKIHIAKENSSQILLDNKKYIIPQAILEQVKPKYKWIETNSSNTNTEDNDKSQSNIANEDYKDNSSFFEQIQEITASNVLEKILTSEKKKFDPQEMLERFRKENRYWRNASWETNYKLLSCKAQPFLQRISILGEIFNK